MITVDTHPLLHLETFVAEFPVALGTLPSPSWLTDLLNPLAPSPFSPPDETIRGAVRDLLRKDGYKPTGRGKPASEYLQKAAAEKTLSSINAVVDACNAASLHSGLPISVVDLALAQPPLRVGVAPAGSEYVFNASGQVISLTGLLCLFDSQGPCANAVKDAQRTKTSATTQRTLQLIWGSQALGERTKACAQWYRELLQRLGATVSAA